MQLIKESRVCLSRDTPTLQGRELQNSLAAVPAWRLGDEGKSICRSFVAKNFMAGAACLTNFKLCSGDLSCVCKN